MVGLLDLAANNACETALGTRLGAILDARQLPDLAALRAEFAVKTPAIVVDIAIPPPDIASYDTLLAAEARP